MSNLVVDSRSSACKFWSWDAAAPLQNRVSGGCPVILFDLFVEFKQPQFWSWDAAAPLQNRVSGGCPVILFVLFVEFKLPQFWSWDAAAPLQNIVSGGCPVNFSRRNLEIERPTYTNLNRLMAQIILSLTAFFAF